MNSADFAEHVADKPAVVVTKQATFTNGQIVEAVNTAYKDLKIPGNAEISAKPKGIEIKWTEPLP